MPILRERRCLLMTMADAVHVHTVEEKRAVAVRPKPAFEPLLEIARIRAGSGFGLVPQEPPDEDSQMAKTTKEPPPGGHEAYTDWCSRWRRGRIELHRKHERRQREGLLTVSVTS